MAETEGRQARVATGTESCSRRGCCTLAMEVKLKQRTTSQNAVDQNYVIALYTYIYIYIHTHTHTHICNHSYAMPVRERNCINLRMYCTVYLIILGLGFCDSDAEAGDKLNRWSCCFHHLAESCDFGVRVLCDCRVERLFHVCDSVKHTQNLFSCID